MTRKISPPANSRRRDRKVLVAMMLAALAGCGDPQLTEMEYLQRAQAFREQGEMRAAIIELKNALSLDPDNPDTRLQLGIIYLEAGVGDAAEKELRRALELGAAESATALPLARALLMQGKYDDLLNEVQPGQLPAGRQRAELHALRATAYLNKGAPDRARKELESAEAEDPDADLVLLTHAQLALVKRQPDEARKWIDRIIEASPSIADAWELLGRLEVSQGRLEQAEQAFGKAMELRHYPGPEVAWRALVRIQAQKYTEAEQDIQRLLDAGLGDNPYVRFVSGINHFSQGRYTEALEDFQKTQSGTDRLPALDFYLAATHHALGHKEQALTFAKRAYARAPDSLRARRLLGSLQIGYSNYGEGRKMLEKLLDRRPDDPAALRLLSLAEIQEGEIAKAIDHLARLVELLPDSQQAKDLLMVARLLEGASLDEFAATGDEKDDYRQRLLLALGELRDGRLASALEIGRRLIQDYPYKADPRKLVATVYMIAGQWDNAEQALMEALERAPDDPSATLTLAKILIHRGRIEEARDRLSAFFGRQPDNEEVALLLSQVAARLDGPEAGMQILAQALEANPEDLPLRVELAAAAPRSGRPDQVLELTQELDDDSASQSPRLLEYRGKAAALAGNTALAEEAFRRWIRIDPQSAKAHFLLAEIQARRGQPEKAVASLERALELDPEYLEARTGLVTLLTKLGRLEAARAQMDKLHKLAPEDPATAAVEGRLALAMGAYDLAIERLTTATQARPDREGVVLLGRALGARGDKKEALELLAGWLEEQPDDLAVAEELAEALIASGKTQEAIERYRAILKQAPDHPLALNNLAWLLRDKAPEEALRYAARAYELAGENPQAMDTYGALLVSQGDHAKGTRLLRRAAKLSPGDLEIRLHLAEALAERQATREEGRSMLQQLAEQAPADIAEQARRHLASMSP